MVRILGSSLEMGPKKPDKYGLKIFEVCESSNGSCSLTDLYVRAINFQLLYMGKCMSSY